MIKLRPRAVYCCYSVAWFLLSIITSCSYVVVRSNFIVVPDLTEGGSMLVSKYILPRPINRSGYKTSVQDGKSSDVLHAYMCHSVGHSVFLSHQFSLELSF